MKDTTHDDPTSTPARASVVFAVLVVVTAVAVPVAATESVTDEHNQVETVADPETSDEYFETFRAMEGTAAYEEYDEFETLRTFAISQTQNTGTLDAEEEAELAAVLETMRTFESAYNNAEDGQFEESLDTMEDVDAAIEELESYDETQATLADLAVARFYERLGDGFREDAEAAERTPDRLELLSMTVMAYERANLPDEAAEFNLRAEQLSAEYENDLDQINETEADAGALLESCSDCTETQAALTGNLNVLALFGHYRTAQTVTADVQDAQAAAESHGLSEREEELAATGDTVSDARTSLALASVSVLLGYGIVVGLFSSLLFGRVFAWQRTYDRAQIGSVVSVGENDV